MLSLKTGTLKIGDSGLGAQKFPKEFKQGIFSRVDPLFAIILLCCFITVFGIFAILSSRKPSEEVTEKEIEKIQERYARLVLNQPKPKVLPPEEKLKKVEKEKVDQVETEKKQETVQVDREKETYVEKQRRRESGTEQRRQKREEVAQQIQSSGIFAAITAAGSSGGLQSATSDLLGDNGENVADIGQIDVTKGAFVTKQVTKEELKRREATRAENITIEKQELKSADIVQVASAAAVNVTSKPPEVTGESSSHADRSQATIQRIVNRETQRLKRVFEDWLKRDPALGGHLTIKFIILPSGAVSTVAIVKSTTNNSSFDETIIRYIKRWQFPAVPDGGPVEVVYPFVFEGQS